MRVDAELDIGTASIDPDLAQARDRGIAHDLVFLVGERLRRRHGDRIPGMNTHRIEVLDRANDDAVVLPVAHNLHLELFPADHRLLDQQLAGRRGFQSTFADGDELFLVVGNTAAGSAERERRPYDGRKADHRLNLHRFLHAVRYGRSWAPQTDFRHRLLEFFAVLGLVDRLLRGTDHFDAELLQHPLPGEVKRAVERSLTAHGRQQRIGALDGNYFFQHLPGDRLNVGDIRHFRVGHDGGRIGVHQDDAIALFAQRLAGLGTGVVELASLADDDRAGADDQNTFYVGALWHRELSTETQRHGENRKSRKTIQLQMRAFPDLDFFVTQACVLSLPDSSVSRRLRGEIYRCGFCIRPMKRSNR